MKRFGVLMNGSFSFVNCDGLETGFYGSVVF
jgi:hypothetical protein